MTRWKRALGASLVGLLLIGAIGSSEAGIVVLKDGRVLVGKLRQGDPKEEMIRLSWPYGSIVERGQMDVPRRDVRWFDPDSDVLTDAYFEQYLSEPLKGAEWLKQREEYKIRQQRKKPGGGIVVPLPPPDFSKWSWLDIAPIQGEGFTVRKPNGWTARSEDGILMLRSPRTRSRGFCPRVHLFSVRAAYARYEDQVGWIRDELARISGSRGFDTVELDRLRRVKGGADQTMRTETRLPKRTVSALRKVCFRGDRTYFFAAYADSRDYPALEGLFRDCLATWRLDCDRLAR